MIAFTNPTAAQKVWNHYRLLRDESYTSRQCRQMTCQKFNLTDAQLDQKLAQAKMHNKREYARKAQYHHRQRKFAVQSRQAENVPTRCQLLADLEELSDLPRDEAITLIARYYGMREGSVRHSLAWKSESTNPGTQVAPEEVELVKSWLRAANGLGSAECGEYYWENRV